MKSKHFLAAIGLALLGTSLFTSCEQKNYYQVEPNNNNNNNNNTGYPYSFDEEFNGADHYNWTFTSATDSAYASISNGNYQIVNYSFSNFINSIVATNANTSGNFTVQTRIKSNNMMALVFGASSSDYGYALYVDSMGYYSLYKEGSNSVAATVIIPSTQDTLYATKKDWNTLEVDQVNGNWTGFINGTQIFQMTARTVSGSSFGFKLVPGTVGYADFLVVKSN